MIRLIRLSTGPDGQSHVEETAVELAPDGRDVASSWQGASRVGFQESPAGSALDWHVAPRRMLVISFSVHLEFVTRDGQRFELRAGDVLLAEDTAGGGHRWRLVGTDPWRRVYVELADGDGVARAHTRE